MESWLWPDDSDVRDDLASRYPLDGYEALGVLVNNLTTAGRRRWRAARQRRRELRLLDRAYALPAYERGR